MSELNYGVNVEILLYDLSQHDSEDIGEFDFYSEDENGREGAATIDITLLAADAVKLIAELKAQRDALAAKGMELCREAAHVYGKYNVTQMPDMDLVDCQTIQEFSDLTGGYIPAWSYLNSVRAEGVEMFASAIEGDSAVGDRVKDLADTFAVQLRAGEPS